MSDRPRRRRGRTALYSAVAIGVVMVVFVAVLATRKSALDQQARSPLLGKIAPPLQGSDLNGHPFDLTSLRGKYVLVNFFASWCVPCQQEQSQLVRFDHTPSNDRTVVGVLYQDTAGAARAYMAGNGGDWPSVPDDGYQHAYDWGVRGPPESYLIAPNGLVLAKFIGGITADRLDQLVDQANRA